MRLLNELNNLNHISNKIGRNYHSGVSNQLNSLYLTIPDYQNKIADKIL